MTSLTLAYEIGRKLAFDQAGLTKESGIRDWLKSLFTAGAERGVGKFNPNKYDAALLEKGRAGAARTERRYAATQKLTGGRKSQSAGPRVWEINPATLASR